MFKQVRVHNLSAIRAKDRRDPVKSHRPELPLIDRGELELGLHHVRLERVVFLLEFGELIVEHKLTRREQKKQNVHDMNELH